MADVHFVVGQPGRTQRLPGHRVRILAISAVTLKGGNEQTSSHPVCPAVVHIMRAWKRSSWLPAIMKLKPFVFHSHFRTMCLFETVLNYLCKWGWETAARSERRRMGYPLQRSCRTASRSGFSENALQLIDFNQTRPTMHHCSDNAEGGTFSCAPHTPTQSFGLIYLIIMMMHFLVWTQLTMAWFMQFAGGLQEAVSTALFSTPSDLIVFFASFEQSSECVNVAAINLPPTGWSSLHGSFLMYFTQDQNVYSMNRSCNALCPLHAEDIMATQQSLLCPVGRSLKMPCDLFSVNSYILVGWRMEVETCEYLYKI